MPNFSELSGLVLSHGTLASMLESYAAPNAKIHSLLKEGRLIGLKKGLYVVAPQKNERLISLPLIANHLYGPSYVSLEFALSQYGLIPEFVATVTSVTTKRGRQFSTPLSIFSYQTLPADYYSLGIRHIQKDTKVAFMQTSPEKALCDWLVLTPNLKIYSAKSLATILLEDMRMDEQALAELDLALIEKIAATGFRQQRLRFLPEFLRNLSC